MTRQGKAFLGVLILKTNPELKIREIKEQISKMVEGTGLLQQNTCLLSNSKIVLQTTQEKCKKKIKEIISYQDITLFLHQEDHSQNFEGLVFHSKNWNLLINFKKRGLQDEVWFLEQTVIFLRCKSCWSFGQCSFSDCTRPMKKIKVPRRNDNVNSHATLQRGSGAIIFLILLLHFHLIYLMWQSLQSRQGDDSILGLRHVDYIKGLFSFLF